MVGTYTMGFLVRGAFRAVLVELQMSGHVTSFRETKSIGTSYFAVDAPIEIHKRLTSAIRNL
jgi:hypothetical protein